MVKRDEPLTQGQEQAFLRLMKVAQEPLKTPATVLFTPDAHAELEELAGIVVPALRGYVDGNGEVASAK